MNISKIKIIIYPLFYTQEFHAVNVEFSAGHFKTLCHNLNLLPSCFEYTSNHSFFKRLLNIYY